jgi:hypothetical protein
MSYSKCLSGGIFNSVHGNTVIPHKLHVEPDEAYSFQDVSDTDDAGVKEVVMNGVVAYLTTNYIFMSMTDLALSSYHMLNKRMVVTPRLDYADHAHNNKMEVFHRPGRSIDQEHESKRRNETSRR